MTSRRAFLVLALGLALVCSSAGLAQTSASGRFPVPGHWRRFANGVAWGDIASLAPAVDAQNLGPGFVSVHSGGRPSEQAGYLALDLGALGRGYLVHFRVASQNAPIAVFVRGAAGGWRRVFRGSGGEVWPGPSGEKVPYLYIVAAVGAVGPNPVVRYRYDGVKFVADGCDLVKWAGKSIVHLGACESGPAFAFPPRPIGPRLVHLPPGSALPLALKGRLESLSTRQRQAAIDGAHILPLSFRLAVATANCDQLGNCPIFVFHRDDGSLRLVMHGFGDALADIPPRPPDRLISELVVRRRLAGGAESLANYHEPEQPFHGSLLPQATWHVHSCELVEGGRPQPVYCAGGQPVPITGVARSDLTTILSTAQDATGTVWAMASSGLYRWSDDDWTRVPPLVTGAHASYVSGNVGVWPAGDGGVDTLWHVPRRSPRFAERWVVVWHRGAQRRLLFSFSLPKSGAAAVAATSLGLLWISASPARLFRAGPRTGARAVFAFTPGEVTPAQQQGRFYSPLEVTEDGRGRSWIWQSGMSIGWHRAPRSADTVESAAEPVLNGFLLDGRGGFRFVAHVPGLPNAPLQLLAPWDQTHLVASLRNLGLYLIDTVSMRAARLPPPPIPLRVEAIYRDGGEHWVVARSPRRPIRSKAGWSDRSDSLWCWHAGRWDLLIDGLDGGGLRGRAFLASGPGVWISSAGNGIWFVPRHHRPELVNWRRGLPLTGVRKVYRLPGARFLFVGWEAGKTATVAMPISSLNEKRARAKGFQLFGSVVRDARDRMWTLTARSLDVWNGKKWRRYPLPAGESSSAVLAVVPDTAGDVWLLPSRCRFGPAAVLDPATGGWQVFRNFHMALLRVGRKLVPLHEQWFLQPMYGPSGQILLRGECNGVSYYNGRRWRLLPVAAIPQARQIDPALEVRPFFGSDGLPAVNLAGRTWEWSSSGWKHVASERPPMPAPPLMRAGVPPANCPTLWPSSFATDRLGREWWTAGGNLYEAPSSAGRCRVVFSASEAQPFADGRALGQVLVDSQGNIFLETRPSGDFVFVKAPPGRGYDAAGFDSATGAANGHS